MYTNFMSENYKGKGPFGRHRHGWEDNIKWNFGEIKCVGASWIHVAEHRDQWQTVMNTVMIYQVP
jgi:hypothetical protein